MSLDNIKIWFNWLLESISNLSWYFGTISGISFSYISSPESIQKAIHKKIPIPFKKFILSYVDLLSLQVYIFSIAILLIILSQIFIKVKQKKDKNLIALYINENEKLKNFNNSLELNTYSIFSMYLKTIFIDLKMTSEERVSIYKLELDKFSCIGRYSQNENYRQKTNRLYSKEEGCIGKAWESGSHDVTDCPEYSLTNNSWYVYNVKKYNFKLEVLEGMRMKSCSLKGTRLKNSKGQVIAVIIFESTSKGGVKFTNIQKYLNSNNQTRLVDLIEALNVHIPSLDNAKKEGF